MVAQLAATFAHTYELQQRRRPIGKGDRYRVEVTSRYVCACRWSTEWCAELERARRQIGRHVLDGQLELLP